MARSCSDAITTTQRLAVEPLCKKIFSDQDILWNNQSLPSMFVARFDCFARGGDLFHRQALGVSSVKYAAYILRVMQYENV